MTDDNLTQETTQTEMSSAFVKQRRNLLAISIVMPLFLISGATLEQINVLGNVISIKNSDFLIYALYVLFVYFLWRYLQYYWQEQRRKTFKSALNKNITIREEYFFRQKSSDSYKSIILGEDTKNNWFTNSRELHFTDKSPGEAGQGPSISSKDIKITYNVFSKLWKTNILGYLKYSGKNSYASDYHLPLWVAIVSFSVVFCYKISSLLF